MCIFYYYKFIMLVIHGLSLDMRIMKISIAETYENYENFYCRKHNTHGKNNLEDLPVDYETTK